MQCPWDVSGQMITDVIDGIYEKSGWDYSTLRNFISDFHGSASLPLRSVTANF